MGQASDMGGFHAYAHVAALVLLSWALVVGGVDVVVRGAVVVAVLTGIPNPNIIIIYEPTL